MNRAAARIGFGADTRLTLVENDLDSIDDHIDRLTAQLDGIRKVLIGILVSVTTAAILLAVNVVVIGGAT